MDEIVEIVMVPLLAVLAPLIVRLLGRWVAIPVVVLEIVLGIVFGPDVLDWIHPHPFLLSIASFGLAMLFFVAGTEIDFAHVAGRPLRRSGLAWLISLAAAIGIGFLTFQGVNAAIVTGICLSSTAMGAVLPILRDSGQLGTPFGIAVSAIGAVGEFGPLIAISLFLGGRNVGWSSAVLFGFVIVAAVTIWVATRVRHDRVHRLVEATLDTTGQFAIRLIVLIMALLVALSMLLGLDMLLGAFTAGVLWRIIMARAPEQDRRLVESKVDGIAFGFLVPIFFIETGVGFNLAALIDEPWLFALVGVFLVVLLLVRGLPTQLVAPKGTGRADRARLGLYAATGLPIIVAATTLATQQGLLSPGIAAALVAAGMLSVLVFPVLAAIGRPHAAVEHELDESVDPDDVGGAEARPGVGESSA